MSKPMIRIFELDGTVIDREMNDAEFEQYQIDQAQFAAEQNAMNAKINAKQSAMDKLTALGLTADEVAALIP